MLTSHSRVHQTGEPAARELEVERIRSAMHRAAELSDDDAAAVLEASVL